MQQLIVKSSPGSGETAAEGWQDLSPCLDEKWVCMTIRKRITNLWFCQALRQTSNCDHQAEKNDLSLFHRLRNSRLLSVHPATICNSVKSEMMNIFMLLL